MPADQFLRSEVFWTALSAVCAASVVGYKVFQWVQGRLKRLTVWITGITESTDLVRTHLTRNGGSSLLDKVVALEQTQRARAERELLFHEDADFGYFLCNATGEYLRASRTFYRITGRTPGDILGYGWVNSLAPENRDIILDRWSEALEQHREFAETVSFRRPDDTRVSLQVRALPILMDGKVAEWVGVAREMPFDVPYHPNCPLVARG
jgi:PAS domain S-box-containing protein